MPCVGTLYLNHCRGLVVIYEVIPLPIEGIYVPGVYILMVFLTFFKISSQRLLKGIFFKALFLYQALYN
jgi:hypothetical protein